MDLHARLDARLPRTTYAQKLLLVAFVATHVPLLALVAQSVLAPGQLSRGAVLLVVLVATLLGTAGLLRTLHLLLRPVRDATAALEGYLQERRLPALPDDRRDDAGRLLRYVRETCSTLEHERVLLERLAGEDELTGLANRRAGTVELAGRVARAQAEGSAVSVALVDLDHFKRVNDEHGHAAGDAALELVAHVLGTHLREEDFAARWGGEELLVVLDGSERQAVGALERVRRALARERVPVGSGSSVRVTASVGVAEALPGESVEACLRRADAALYAAKGAGRNQVHAASAPVLAAATVPVSGSGGW